VRFWQGGTEYRGYGVPGVRSTGGTEYQYITSVLDPQKLSILDIARVYARRWDIELAFKLVKRYLRLHMLWSAKKVVVQRCGGAAAGVGSAHYLSDTASFPNGDCRTCGGGPS
jgi:hypothetical protein